MGEEDAVASNNTNAGTKSGDGKKPVASGQASRNPVSLQSVNSKQVLVSHHSSGIDDNSIQSTL